MPAGRHRSALGRALPVSLINVPFKSPIRASVWCWVRYGRMGVREIGAASIRRRAYALRRAIDGGVRSWLPGTFAIAAGPGRGRGASGLTPCAGSGRHAAS